MSTKLSQPQIIDYEGSKYRTDFWEGQGREYEDQCERAAIRRLLPSTGDIIMEAGAGFGRLADLYDGYKTIILVDYSLSLLQEARQRWKDDDRFVFVAASIYDLPLVDKLLDAAVMVRVMHHLQEPHMALDEIARVLKNDQPFVFEYANKRNLKSLARYFLRRQSWSPFAQEPYEFLALNFDFHPSWMRKQLKDVGFEEEESLAISNFRLDVVKRLLPTPWLVRMDTALARPGAMVKLSPSILVKCRNKNHGSDSVAGFFRCPLCSCALLNDTNIGLKCSNCGIEWPIVNGIYDFRSNSKT